MTTNQNPLMNPRPGREMTPEQRSVMEKIFEGVGPLPRGPVNPAAEYLGPRAEREIREQAIVATTYISPEMGTFGDEDEAYFTRFFATAERIAAWIRDGI